MNGKGKKMTDNLTELIKPDILLKDNYIPTDEEIDKELSQLSTDTKNKKPIVSDYILARNKEEDEKITIEKIDVGLIDTHIKTIDFYTWFKKYENRFDNFSELEIKVDGVRPEEIICVDMPVHGGTLVNGHPQRRIEFIRNPDKYFILNLEPVSLDFLTKGLFVTTQIVDENNFIISYGIRSSLANFYGIQYDNFVLPVIELPKMKRRSDIYDIFIFDEKISLDELLMLKPDTDMIGYNYPPFKKLDETNFKTKFDVILWLLTKRQESIDLAHWMTIDSTICKIINLPLKINNCPYMNI